MTGAEGLGFGFAIKGFRGFAALGLTFRWWALESSATLSPCVLRAKHCSTVRHRPEPETLYPWIGPMFRNSPSLRGAYWEFLVGGSVLVSLFQRRFFQDPHYLN